MVFDLFTKYGRAKTQAEKCFASFLPIYTEASPEDIAEVLDAAKDLKSMGRSPIEKIYYENPQNLSIDNYYEIAESHDRERKQSQHLVGYNSPHNQKYVAALWIWDLSLMACHITEVKHKGIIMWQELSKGFAHCNSFDPEEDVPQELWVEESIKCPQCAETIKKAAKVCKYCRYNLVKKKFL